MASGSTKRRDGAERGSGRETSRAVADLGAVYTPRLLADWMATLLLERLDAPEPTIVDPACGDGALLDAVGAQRGARLVGVDCDAGAVAAIGKRLPSARVVQRDGLERLAEAFAGGGQLEADGVIANPPWGARLSRTREELASLGFELATGQVDSWDLFVEGMVKAARPGATIVLVVPDSLFLPEHTRTRALLASACSLEVLARLGVGFFDGVYRGCAVLALHKGSPAPSHEVRCLRLGPSVRKAVLGGGVTLDALLEQQSHTVAQTSFTNDPEVRFSLDTSLDDRPRIEQLERRSFAWSDWTVSGRGIELSKSGRIVRCPNCGHARPAPRSSGSVECLACGRAWNVTADAAEAIVVREGARDRGPSRDRPSQRVASDWQPLIVGEDVGRHVCQPSGRIRWGVPGIRYKPLEQFRAKKLLVRKTGVGIKAAVDESGAATTQVVFHFIARPGAPDYLLDFLQGVLCSRTLLAWHLKRNGESEWRSHPYVTQRMIRGFPIPSPESPEEVARARAIAQAVVRRRSESRHDGAADLEIERLVAGLYRFELEDMRWVLGVLDAAQQLEPIRSLAVPSLEAVEPRRLSDSRAGKGLIRHGGQHAG